MGSEDLVKPNFYEAHLRKSETVFVGGQPTIIRTFSCLDHLLFEKCRQAYVSALDIETTGPKERYSLFVKLLDASKIDWRCAAPTELPDLVLALVRVNVLPPALAWQTNTPKTSIESKTPLEEDFISYEGRSLAALVATLANTFKWTSNYILDELTLYEFNCYVQEALLLQHQKEELQYNLTDVGFEKVGESYKKVPYPALSWTKKVSESKELELFEKAKSVKTPPGYSPDGVVYDFSTYTGKGPVPKIEIPVVNKDQQVVAVSDETLVK